MNASQRDSQGRTAGPLTRRINQRVYLIAEIGVNHAGSASLAARMVEQAAASGADAVKFQTFTAESLVTPGTPKVRYQESTTTPAESHFEMIRRLEFSRAGHGEIQELCRRLHIDFLSTPYDIGSARFLIEELGLDIVKVASADIVDTRLNEYLASTGCGVILSTGMCSLGEVEDAVAQYAHRNAAELCLLHCVSNYPCSDESLNLRAMTTLAAAFGLPVGLSDHSVDAQAAAMSVALGGQVVEKHFTLDKGMAGPDHRASSTPTEFAELARAVRRAEAMLGDGIKRIQAEERQMSQVARKAIVAARNLDAGVLLVESDLALKRPGTGLSGKWLSSLIGKRTVRAVGKDEQLGFADIVP